jgi:hypothetical protein
MNFVGHGRFRCTLKPRLHNCGRPKTFSARTKNVPTPVHAPAETTKPRAFKNLFRTHEKMPPRSIFGVSETVSGKALAKRVQPTTDLNFHPRYQHHPHAFPHQIRRPNCLESLPAPPFLQPPFPAQVEAQIRAIRRRPRDLFSPPLAQEVGCHSATARQHTLIWPAADCRRAA